MAAIAELILARRSVSPRKLAAPVPTQSELEILMRAAASAPDHKQLRPFRFILVPDHKRADLAAAFRAAKLERDPGSSEEELARASDKAFRGPMLMAVVMRIVRDHPRVSVSDQMITVGAAVQAMLLAAAGFGYSACLRSGVSATSRCVRVALGLEPSEELAAFLMLGTAAIAPPLPSRSADGLLTTWG